MTSKPYVVVAGTDFSADAARALQAAFEHARREVPAELHVAHVAFAVVAEPTRWFLPEVDLATMPAQSLDELNARLLSHIDAVLGPQVRREPGVRVIGHAMVDVPSVGLSQLASELEADLLVVGSHGLRGIARWVLGSVAESTLRTATCPVLVIPPPAQDPVPVPKIEPPCPRCVDARKASAGAEMWCEQHRERHGRRHTYYQADRGASDTNMPLVVSER
ncbi:MAG TPA: universal stress protein [Polyangiaceae bacterium]|nr:universal stress protein [Polyangiaceae bacterium]